MPENMRHFPPVSAATAFRRPALLMLSTLATVIFLCIAPAAQAEQENTESTAADATTEDTAIQCANLIYGMNQTSRCFSDEFLSAAQRETTIPTERRFKSVKLNSEELFAFPFVVMTGESSFFLASKERENLESYLSKGGFLLASAGCSSKDWDRSFRTEMRRIFGEDALKKIPLDHALFRTVHEITELKLQRPGEEAALEGIELNGKIVAVYSAQGLNDTSNTHGCCCCGGNELTNSMEVNVNIFVYALLH